MAARAPGNDENEDGSQYQRAFEAIPVPAWILDRATLQFLAANRAARAYYGYTRENFLRMRFTDLHRPEDVMEVRRRLGQYAHSRGMHAWSQKRSTGEAVLTQVAWLPLGFDQVPAILMVAYPSVQVKPLLHEAEESRSRLEALTWRLVRVQEAERAQLARELHDEIGQLLTGLKFLVSAGGVASGQRPEVTQILNELIGRVRDVSMDLRPPMLEEVGLVPTLEWYFGRYTARTSVQVSFQQTAGNTRFQDALEIAAFRIIQEALTNVARHAQTESVSVEVRVDPEGLWIVVEDKGRGFDAVTISRGSAGITGMQERAHLVGGHLTLESSIGSGTRIAVVLPLLGSEWGGQDSES